MGLPVQPGVFDAALEYINGWTGISLPETKYRSLREYLLRFPADMDFSAIINVLERDADERESFLGIVTINETYFFREQRQFALLQSKILPELATRAKSWKFWSAACSTGEEAVSLAVLGRSMVEADRLLVYAGDISPQALARCAEGRYGPNSFRDDGKDFFWLLDSFCSREGKQLVVGNELRQNLRYGALNLVDPAYPDIPEGLHIVFMRNALMYMPMATRQAVVARVAAKLADSGCLFFSSSEIAHLSHPDLSLEEADGVYYFRKKSYTEKSRGSTVSGHTFVAGLRHDNAIPERQPRIPAPVSITPDQIAQYASQRLNNPLFEEPGLPAYQAALLCLEIVYELRTGKGVAALVELLESRWGVNALSRFLVGVSTATIASGISGPGDELPAEAFRDSLRLDARFWPARLKLAMTLRESSPAEARSEFKRCATDIESYLAAGRYEYQFILEGFNAKYFLDLCNGWFRKLVPEGALHGTR